MNDNDQSQAAVCDYSVENIVVSSIQETIEKPADKKESLNWKEKLQALGPGILMASAAVGGSHIIMSTQAGAKYGWQLVSLIILTNVFKYPFFRFGAQYTLASNKTLIEGYKEKGIFYLYLFFILNVFSEAINIAGVGIVTAAILKFLLPEFIQFSIPIFSVAVISGTLIILLLGHYRALDFISKAIMIILTITTITAVAFAIPLQRDYAADFVEVSPYTMAGLAFIVPLMGWMPAPIEISAINSMWVKEQQKEKLIKYEAGLFDFNVGFIGTAILAIFFVALGALIQYGSGQPIQNAGVAYIGQLVNMYAIAIGDWAKLLIAIIAFMCMFGTTITVIDGYSRANAEALRLIRNKENTTNKQINIWMIVMVVIALIIIVGFMRDVASMLNLAMICSFITTPIFAWLNLQLVKEGEHRVRGWLYQLSLIGLFFLSGFALLFIYQHFF